MENNLTDQEGILLGVLQQIKLEGEVRIGLESLMKVSGVKNVAYVASVLRSQGFVQNQSVKQRESILVWNRTEPPNINNVRAVIKEAKRLSTEATKKSYAKKTGSKITPPLQNRDLPLPIAETSVEYEALQALHDQAVKEFDRAKDKLHRINELMKLYK